MKLTEKQAVTVFAIIALTLTLALGLLSDRHDFIVYYRAGQSLLSGRVDLYAPDFALSPIMDYRYPPLFLLAFLPLWLLPYQYAVTLWYIIEVGALVGCVSIFWRETKTSSRKLAVWVIAFLIVEQYAVNILRTGNAHPLLVCLMFWALCFFNRGRNLIAAFLMALAITIKPLPLLFMPYFPARKQWRFPLIVLVLLVALNIVPAAYFGVEQNTQLLKTWVYQVVLDPGEFHEANGPINLSIKGQLRRYLTGVDYSQRLDHYPYPEVNIASFSPKLTDSIWLMLCAGLLLIACSQLWRSEHSSSWKTGEENARPRQTFMEQGVFVCLMLMISPFMLKAYYIALLWPAVALADYAFNHQGRAARVGRWLSLMAAGVNLLVPLLPGRHIQRLLLVIGIDPLITGLLMIGLLCAIASVNRSGEGVVMPQRITAATNNSLHPTP